MATKARPPPPPKPKSPAKSAAAVSVASHNGNGLTAAHITDTTAVVSANNGTAHNIASATSTPPPRDHESVVMTPRGKTATSTVILIERKLVESIGDRQHVAGGQHTGIIINKDELGERRSDHQQPQLSLEFRVFLVSAQTGEHSQESRSLRFWFRDWLTDGDRQAHVAQDFFRELVAPKEFPRNYVGFITKIMKLMQKGYNEIQALEVELRILEQTSAPPSRPPRDGHLIFCYGDCNRKFEAALSASRTSLHSTAGSHKSSAATGQPNSVDPADCDHQQPNALMKKFWLEIYDRHYRYQRPPHQRAKH